MTVVFATINGFSGCRVVIEWFHDQSGSYRECWRRQIKSLFFGRPDGPEGCPMVPVTIRLYKMMWWLHRELRPELLRAIFALNSEKRIIHIRSPRELGAFIENPV